MPLEVNAAFESKAAKDVASAAVLTSGVGGLVAGLVIFGAYILGDRSF